jgi:hypothetical protein
MVINLFCTAGSYKKVFSVVLIYNNVIEPCQLQKYLLEMP